MARKRRSETAEARRFAVALAVLLAAVAAYGWWRHHPLRVAVSMAAAAAVALCAAALPALWVRAFRLGMKLAEGLSWVTTRVVLSLFFYLVLTPVGIVFRIARRDPLDLAWKDGKPTYWIDRGEEEATVERYERMF